ncbi:uncharacterized protein MELLADRAFT_93756 [Melampsora larici-populina 98AG31]|uniref:TRUD domain-containing protein n=1 Tax=Melampsora larici-populina (strain 98AG31 / pathotype 3-4-7) TaxID=747676 RepID=F4S550_MELLP|nr:uncharacterized protein MELLADRAFT_93756 [Melampsora larici-populina 98AG31]EGG00259.1 hypothetical protein MELLADRAFT_93756 [Melampsora larici-populina 98AG31]
MHCPQICKNLNMIYMHIYQSYIWSYVLSERVQLYGCESEKPAIEDLPAVTTGGKDIVEVALDGDNKTATREIV